MASGPSPKTSSPSSLPVSSLMQGSFGSNSSTSPKDMVTMVDPVATELFGTTVMSKPHAYKMTLPSDRIAADKPAGLGRAFLDNGPPVKGPDMGRPATILLRKLPRNIGVEALHGMLLFAKDFMSAEFVEWPDEKGLSSAVAHFKTLAGANEARDRLNGKAITSSEANMIVEVLPPGAPISMVSRRNTIDGLTGRHSNTSIGGSISGPLNNGGRQSSRFNGTFQHAREKLSPPTSMHGVSNGEFPVPESSPHFQNLFSPQSPLANSSMEHPRVSGKSVINDDAGDDETGELLKDPIAYAKNGHANQINAPRRQATAQMPIARFAGLSLSTNGGGGVNSPGGSSSGFVTPRGVNALQSPVSTMHPNSLSNGMNSMSPNGAYALNQPFQRHNYPPINPADQNPPCNTLYVGNLPIDTSEDELKAMFSKQRGYKRLCFRTKQNGPMCFVEFEDVSFATKALNELYGHPLHNSVKGGIRLSFSKNPLGVRAGQNNPLGPHSPLNLPANLPGFGSGIASTGFTAASGPPPGLAAPPGLGPSQSNSINSTTSPSNANNFTHGGFGLGHSLPPAPRPHTLSGSLGAGTTGDIYNNNVQFMDFMTGN